MVQSNTFYGFVTEGCEIFKWKASGSRQELLHFSAFCGIYMIFMQHSGEHVLFG